MGTLTRKKAKNKKRKNAKIPSESDSSTQLRLTNSSPIGQRPEQREDQRIRLPPDLGFCPFFGGIFKPKRHHVREDVWQEGGQGSDGGGGDPEAAGDRGDAHEEAGVPGKED